MGGYGKVGVRGHDRSGTAGTELIDGNGNGKDNVGESVCRE